MPRVSRFRPLLVMALTLLTVIGMNSAFGQKKPPGNGNGPVCNTVRDAVCSGLCVRVNREACCNACYDSGTNENTCKPCTLA